MKTRWKPVGPLHDEESDWCCGRHRVCIVRQSTETWVKERDQLCGPTGDKMSESVWSCPRNWKDVEIKRVDLYLNYCR